MLSAMLLAFCSSSPAETADISEMYDVHVKPYKQYVHHQIYPISKIKRNTQLYSINRCLHYHTCTPYMCDECLHCRTCTIFLSDCLRNSLRELKKKSAALSTRHTTGHCRPTLSTDHDVRQCRSTMSLDKIPSKWRPTGPCVRGADTDDASCVTALSS